MEKISYLINKSLANIEVYGSGGIVIYTISGVIGVLLIGSGDDSGLHSASELAIFNGSGTIGAVMWTSSTIAKKIRNLLI